MGANARLAVLSQPDDGPATGEWDPEVLLPAESDYRAMHSLQVVDLDEDGTPEVFVAEMENGKKDGIERKSQWFTLRHVDGGRGDIGESSD